MLRDARRALTPFSPVSFAPAQDCEFEADEEEICQIECLQKKKKEGDIS